MSKEAKTIPIVACPKCQGKTEVYYTRFQDGEIVRSRVCKRCDNTFRTTQKPESLECCSSGGTCGSMDSGIVTPPL
jgi:hypothetical protein